MINLIVELLGFSKEDESALKPKIEIKLKSQEFQVFERTLDNADSEAIDLLKKMLVMNPSERYSIEEVLKHPFLINDENNKNLFNIFDDDESGEISVSELKSVLGASKEIP